MSDEEDPLKPAVETLVKLGSLIVHYQERDSPSGHAADQAAINGLLSDPELKRWFDQMHGMALLSVKR